MRETLKRGGKGPDRKLLPTMVRIVAGRLKSLNPQKQNPKNPRSTIESNDLEELKSYLIGLGASSVGYTQVPEAYIFRNKGILHTNAIALSMEMDKDAFEITPSFECEVAVMDIYRDLGIIANKGADWLRKRGYSAQAGHALMGVALYPALAQQAGLGLMGKNGILITPEHGPRVRLGTIFTSIDNLPDADVRDHDWIADYCEACNICVKKCPVGAIHSNTADRTGKHMKFVDTEVCFPQFADEFGCAVCIGVCPFNSRPYEDIKAGHLRKGTAKAVG